MFPSTAFIIVFVDVYAISIWSSMWASEEETEKMIERNNKDC